jgi:xylan 1,4-beta-xylosidase
MFGMMKGSRVAVQSPRMYPLRAVLDSSVRTRTDIGALAAKDQHTATIMVWNYHDANLPGVSEPVQVRLNGVPASAVTVTHYRIDAAHSNSYEVWKKMGSPPQPTAAQIATLEKAGKLQTFAKPAKHTVRSGTLALDLAMPRQGVSLLKVDW